MNTAIDAPSIRLRSSRWARLELEGPWGAAHQPSRVPMLYVIEQGSAVISTQTEVVEVAAGDLVVLPRGDAYRIASDHRAETPPIEEFARMHQLECTDLLSVRGPGASMLAAGFSFSAPLETEGLLRSAPELLVLRADACESWTPDIARALGKVARDSSPRAVTAATKLGELVFGGALALLLDSAGGVPLVLATESVLRASLDFPWTAAELARRLGRSRASFYEAFTRATGTSPMAHLTMMRLREGERLLRETELTVEAIAVTVGFASASSFASAFRARFGRSPASYRGEQRGRTGTGPALEVVTSLLTECAEEREAQAALLARSSG